MTLIKPIKRCSLFILQFIRVNTLSAISTTVMDRLLAPEKFDTDSDAPDAAIEWEHWYRRFLNFSMDRNDSDKLRLLFNYISSKIYLHVNAAGTFNDAISILKSLYVKPVNEVYNRHKLATRFQSTEESIDSYLKVLNLLAKECNFKAVTAEKHRDDFVRDAFIRGLSASHIRQRLLENSSLTLSEAYEKARSLELAQQQASSYNQNVSVNAIDLEKSSPVQNEPESKIDKSAFDQTIVATVKGKCFFCGFAYHLRTKCPARNAICNICKKKDIMQRFVRVINLHNLHLL